jgi:hypothetical protein
MFFDDRDQALSFAIQAIKTAHPELANRDLTE